jgi:hypothetical protein
MAVNRMIDRITTIAEPAAHWNTATEADSFAPSISASGNLRSTPHGQIGLTNKALVALLVTRSGAAADEIIATLNYTSGQLWFGTADANQFSVDAAYSFDAGGRSVLDDFLFAKADYELFSGPLIAHTLHDFGTVHFSSEYLYAPGDLTISILLRSSLETEIIRGKFVAPRDGAFFGL